MGEVEVRPHRPIRGPPEAVTVARRGRRRWVSVRFRAVPAQLLPPTGPEVGIDLGVGAPVATNDRRSDVLLLWACRARDRRSQAEFVCRACGYAPMAM